jgi:4,5-dihydroxyphthalate decarboxylase
MLQHEYGVNQLDIEWVRSGVEQPGRDERIDFPLPEGLRLVDNREKSLCQLLVDREVDAIMVPIVPSIWKNHDPRVRRLFENPKQVEREYYTRTGIFPIMHGFAIKSDLCERHPWLPMSLYKAFAEAKHYTEQWMYGTGSPRNMNPWWSLDLEEVHNFMGQDFWPYGVEPNRKSLEAFVQYAFEQGLTPQRVSIESLFAPSTVEEWRI